MREEQHNYHTVISENLLIPIVKLIESFKELHSPSVNEVQTSQFENGYSTAIILLTVCFIESELNKIKLIQGKTSERYSLKFFKNSFPQSGLEEKLTELYVVRDVIIHNHIWDAKIKNDNYDLKLVSASLLEGYGDNKFEDTIDTKTRKTKTLNINLFPTRINWKDVVVILKTALEIVLFLEKKDKRYVNTSILYFDYKNKAILFEDIVNALD